MLWSEASYLVRPMPCTGQSIILPQGPCAVRMPIAKVGYALCSSFQ